MIGRTTLIYLTKQLPTATHHTQLGDVREGQRFVVHVDLRWLLQYQM